LKTASVCPLDAHNRAGRTPTIVVIKFAQNIGSLHGQNSEISQWWSRLHAQWPNRSRRWLVLTSGLRQPTRAPPHPVLCHCRSRQLRQPSQELNLTSADQAIVCPTRISSCNQLCVFVFNETEIRKSRHGPFRDRSSTAFVNLETRKMTQQFLTPRFLVRKMLNQRGLQFRFLSYLVGYRVASNARSYS
jgi:hypothetical protein